MNLVGELVLARNQILQFTKKTEDAGLVTAGQRLNLIASELQESVMKTRMQPIGSIWSRFPRTVRDVALGCGKQVRIQMEGQETELDKTLIEAIKDPLTHLVRNAVDHGVEHPEARRAAGKDPEGILLLRAFHEGGQVNIEISDDGAGLNLEKVVQKALQKGLITADHAARMTEREMANLIFAAGLSTAEKVTNVSGRGVGMDVVKTNIERIGGTVDVQTALGKGTSVKIKIPLTLAIVPALIVTSAGQRFAIPQVSLLELVGLDGNQVNKGIEMIHGAPVYRLRGRLLPLVYLKQVLKTGLAGGESSPGNGTEGSDVSEADLAPSTFGANSGNAFERVNIVVLQADGRRFGLVVDEISDTEEIVVKPLDAAFETYQRLCRSHHHGRRQSSAHPGRARPRPVFQHRGRYARAGASRRGTGEGGRPRPPETGALRGPIGLAHGRASEHVGSSRKYSRVRRRALRQSLGHPVPGTDSSAHPHQPCARGTAQHESRP